MIGAIVAVLALVVLVGTLSSCGSSVKGYVKDHYCTPASATAPSCTAATSGSKVVSEITDAWKPRRPPDRSGRGLPALLDTFVAVRPRSGGGSTSRSTIPSGYAHWYRSSAAGSGPTRSRAEAWRRGGPGERQVSARSDRRPALPLAALLLPRARVGGAARRPRPDLDGTDLTGRDDRDHARDHRRPGRRRRPAGRRRPGRAGLEPGRGDERERRLLRLRRPAGQRRRAREDAVSSTGPNQRAAAGRPAAQGLDRAAGLPTYTCGSCEGARTSAS